MSLSMALTRFLNREISLHPAHILRIQRLLVYRMRQSLYRVDELPVIRRLVHRRWVTPKLAIPIDGW